MISCTLVTGSAYSSSPSEKTTSCRAFVSFSHNCESPCLFGGRRRRRHNPVTFGVFGRASWRTAQGCVWKRYGRERLAGNAHLTGYHWANCAGG